MEDRNEDFTADRLHENICALAEQMGISAEEAEECFSRAVQEIKQGIKEVFEKLGLWAFIEQIEESGIFDIEPSHRRRKRERDRARLIEQRYGAEIRRCERARPFRQIYKPP